jgi:hypothetical protein
MVDRTHLMPRDIIELAVLADAGDSFGATGVAMAVRACDPSAAL